MKATKDNTFCSYPFRELAIKAFNKDKLIASWPCCMMGNMTKSNHIRNKLGIENLDKLSPEEIFDHPRMEQLRRNSKYGIKDPACVVCWDQESAGLTSFRQFSDEVISDEEINNPTLTIIDITTSNVCNLRCRMCSPSSSNSLMEDQKYFKEHNLTDRYINASKYWNAKPTPMQMTESVQWEWLLNNTEKIKLIKASGGEPFYDNKVIKLIDRYIQTGAAADTVLHFHTNGTVLDDLMIEKLNNFKRNEHTFSIDGFGSSYDYIRHPAKFADLDAIIRNYVKKIDNLFVLHLAIVVSSLNLLNVDKFLEWGNSLGHEPVIAFAEINPHDRGTHISRLPIHLLELAKERILKVNGASTHYDNLLTMIDNAISNNQEDRLRMLDEVEPFDLSRNQHYSDFLDPALTKWLKNE